MDTVIPYTQITAGPIEELRRSHRFLRSVAAAVTVAFTMLILTPTVVAAQNEIEDQQRAAALTASDEAKLAEILQKIEERVTRFAEKLDKQLVAVEDEQDLQRLRRKVEELDVKIQAKFDQIAERLQEKNLPQVILDRHEMMVETYRGELARLLENLNAVELAPDDGVRQEKLEAARQHLRGKKHKRAQQPFDPDNLPNKSRKADPNNRPKRKKAEFQGAGLYDTPFIQLAALGEFTFDLLPGADDPAFLAETDEVRLTQQIRDKAAELDHDPVKIHHWVRNHIEWLPTWGAVQDSDLTLAARRGNAMDIASLTIALLRASGIPARYVHGTIEVPEARFRNWAGNFSDIDAAANFAASGGIPTATATAGGVISDVQLEHVWVEAAIDYHPSRGAVNRAADSWVQMDSSYKQYEFLQGLDVIETSGIDPEQLAQSFVDSGTINESEGWVTGFDPSILENAQTQAQKTLEAHITNNMIDPTVGDVIGGRKTIIKEYPVLPSSLPNPIIVEGVRYDKLPGQLQQKITYSLGRDQLGQPISPVTFPWTRLNNRKVTLSFRPAAEADQQALAALLPEGEITDISQLPSSIPSYLIYVVPELKVDGQVAATGNPMRLGEDLGFRTQVKFAGRSNQAPYTYQVVAGSYLSVNVVAGSVSPEKLANLQTRLEQTRTILETNDQTQISDLTREDLLGDIVHAGTLGYYAQYLALSHIAGLAQGAHQSLAAGTGTLGYEPRVAYFFGFPRAIEPGGIALDIPLETVTAVNDGDWEKRKQFVLQTGILSSALEHAVPEQMFASQDPHDPKPDAISAVKALQKASASEQRIYHITPLNKDDVLPNIHHDSGTMAEIRSALAVGKEVITHTDAVSVPGWSGAGYIILDPETGDGAYKINGGMNGGFLAGFLLGIAMIISFIALFFTSGGLVGLFATLAPLSVIGSLFGSAVLGKIFSGDPEFWTCFEVGFAVALYTTAVGGLFLESISVSGVTGVVLGSPITYKTIHSCFAK